MQNIEMNIHGFRFIEIETGFVVKPNRIAINRIPLPPLKRLIIRRRGRAIQEAETVWTVSGQKYCHLYERRIPRLRRYGQ